MRLEMRPRSAYFVLYKYIIFDENFHLQVEKRHKLLAGQASYKMFVQG
jgi:hypothetical protein